MGLLTTIMNSNQVNLKGKEKDKINIENAPNSLSSSKINLHCRYCLQSDNENDSLISPCKCTGSMQFIHTFCLRKWLMSKCQSVGSNQIVNILPKESMICEICKQIYPWNIEINGNQFEILVKPNGYNPYMILESELDNLYFLLDFSSVSKIKAGRSSEADFQINDITISRKQFSIDYENEKFYIKDKGSKFGTLIKTNKSLIHIEKTDCLLINGNVYRFSFEKSFSILNYFGRISINSGCCGKDPYNSNDNYRNRYNTEIP